jgi:hypothetical protein
MSSSADYGYNDKIGDVIRPLGQGKVQKLENGFRTIPNVEITDNSYQKRVDTGNLATGQMRGTQQIRGQIQVVSAYGRKLMVMGYGKGKF